MPSVTDEDRGGAVQVRDFKQRAKEGEGLARLHSHILLLLGISKWLNYNLFYIKLLKSVKT